MIESGRQCTEIAQQLQAVWNPGTVYLLACNRYTAWTLQRRRKQWPGWLES
jgi:hypothetical protein